MMMIIIIIITTMVINNGVIRSERAMHPAHASLCFSLSLSLSLSFSLSLYFYFFSNNPWCVSVVHMKSGFSTVITLVSSWSIFRNCFGGLNMRACEIES